MRPRPLFLVALMPTLVALLSLLVVALSSAPAHATKQAPPTSPSTATIETLGAVKRTDGWCTSVGTTVVDAWATAPARVTADVKLAARFITIRYSDRTSTGDVCVRLDDATVTKGDAGTAGTHQLLCDGGSNSSDMLQYPGEFTALVLARDLASTARSTPPEAPPSVWMLATATTRVCVTVSW